MDVEYPSDWRVRRRRVFERDDYECRNCGVDGSNRENVELHAHHIVPKSRGGVHGISNLVTLCSECHFAVHNSNLTAPSGKVTIPYDEFLEALYQGIYDGEWERYEEFSSRLSEAVEGIEEQIQFEPSAPPDRIQEIIGPQWMESPKQQTWDHLSSKWKDEFRRIESNSK